MRRTGSARTVEQGSDNWRALDESSCKRWGCDEAAVVEVRDSAVRTRCEAGHVESNCFTQQDEGSEPEFESVADESDEEEPDGFTQAPAEGTLDRTDGYERGRPSEDEVGSDPDSDEVPVVDPSDFVDN